MIKINHSLSRPSIFLFSYSSVLTYKTDGIVVNYSLFLFPYRINYSHDLSQPKYFCAPIYTHTHEDRALINRNIAAILLITMFVISRYKKAVVVQEDGGVRLIYIAQQFSYKNRDKTMSEVSRTVSFLAF